eukprot:1752040-Amphidinium_carterae.1
MTHDVAERFSGLENHKQVAHTVLRRWEVDNVKLVGPASLLRKQQDIIGLMSTVRPKQHGTHSNNNST